MNWLKLKLMAIARLLNPMLKASTDLLKTKNKDPEKKVLELEKKIKLIEKSIESIRGQQEEFKDEFVKLNKILEKASEISQIKRRENLINFSESAILSKKLVKLYQDVPLSVSIDNLNFEERDNQKLINFLRRNEFKSLENRISFDSTSKQNNNGQKKQIEP